MSTKLEKLALCTALAKGVKETIAELRDEADQSLYELFQQDGVDRRQVLINGQKVGTQSITFNKAREGVEMYVENYKDFIDWLQAEEGYDVLAHVVHASTKAFTDYLAETGQVAAGVKALAVNEPASIKGTTLRVDKEKVFKAFGNRLPDAVFGVLGEGNEDE